MLDSTAWFVAHDSDDYAKIYTNSDMDRYMAATAIALGQPEGLGELHQSVIERVLARLSMNFGYCIGPGQAETRLQVAAVDMIPTLFRWLTTNGNHSPDGQAFMFWDSVIPRRKVGPEVRDAMLGALAEQLFMDHDVVRASAAHGMNHLKDNRCLPLLQHAIRTTRDDDLVTYFREATTFRLM